MFCIYISSLQNDISQKRAEHVHTCYKHYCSSSYNPEDKMSGMTQAIEYPFSSPISPKWLFCINILEGCQKHTMYTYYAGFFDIPIVQKVSCQLGEEIILYLGVQDTLYPSKVKLKRRKKRKTTTKPPSQYTHLPQRTTKSPENIKEKNLPEFLLLDSSHLSHLHI